MAQFISFPATAEEIVETKQSFYTLKQFPNVIGAIDCTHVEILSPKKVIPAPIAYINIFNAVENYILKLYRKLKLIMSTEKAAIQLMFRRLQMQILEFTNVVAKFPGRTHDSFIWRNCGLKQRLEQSQQIGWLLGKYDTR